MYDQISNLRKLLTIQRREYGDLFGAQLVAAGITST
jgi:hypothetical protein